MISAYRTIPALLIAGFATLTIGCSEKYPRLAVVPVTGTVLFKGKPPVGAQILLVPVNDASPEGVKPRGVVGPDGTFTLATYPNAEGKPDGAPPGEYLVSLVWFGQPELKTGKAVNADDDLPVGPPGGIQPDRFGGKYSNPQKSNIRVTIKDGETKLDPIELK